tara:strand:- start:20 stop:898 length:879 start_codon:yes stop_codon:yes gene_type:complete
MRAISSSTDTSSGRSTGSGIGVNTGTNKGVQTNAPINNRLNSLLKPLKGKVALAHTSTLNLIHLLTNDINPSLNAITGKSSQLANNKTIMNIKKFFDLLSKSLSEIINYKLDFVNQKLDIFKSKLELKTTEQEIKADMYEKFSKKIEQILADEQSIESAAMATALRTKLTDGLRSTMKGGSSPQISHIKIFQSEFKKILIKLDNISEDISLSVSNKNKKIKKVIKEYKKITLKHIKILKKEQLKLSSKKILKTSKKIIKRPKKSIKKSTKKQMKKSTKKQMKKSTKKSTKKK